MKPGIMALEERLEQPTEEPTNDQVELNVAGVDAADDAMGDALDQVSEAEGIAEAVDGYVEKLGDETTPMEVVDTVEVAMEHFCKRLGYTKKVVPALESFSGTDAAKQRRLAALENLKELQARLGTSIQIAQEGIVDRFCNAFRRGFTSYQDFRNKTPGLVAAAKKGRLTDKAFQDAAWARIYASLDKSEVNANDMVKKMAELEAKRKKLMPHADAIIKLLEDAAHSLRQSSFIAKDEEVAKLNKMRDENRALLDAARGELDNDLGRKASCDVAALTQADAAKLGDAILGACKGAMDKTLDRLYDACNKANAEMFTAPRLVGHMAADMRAYRGLIVDIINPVLTLVYEAWMSEFHYVYGAYRYLGASIE